LLQHIGTVTPRDGVDARILTLHAEQTVLSVPTGVEQLWSSPDTRSDPLDFSVSDHLAPLRDVFGQARLESVGA
jgi:hypothetical protein